MMILIFDSDCPMCNNTVRYIAKKNEQKNLFFCSQFSEVGEELLTKFNSKHLAEGSIVLIEQDQAYFKSEAIRRVLLHMNGWKWVGMMMIPIPLILRDTVYSFIAQRRKSFMRSSKAACDLPDPSIRTQFL